MMYYNKGLSQPNPLAYKLKTRFLNFSNASLQFFGIRDEFIKSQCPSGVDILGVVD